MAYSRLPQGVGEESHRDPLVLSRSCALKDATPVERERFRRDYCSRPLLAFAFWTMETAEFLYHLKNTESIIYVNKFLRVQKERIEFLCHQVRFIFPVQSAGGESRTPTRFAHTILSRACIPIPPLQHFEQKDFDNLSSRQIILHNLLFWQE